MTGRNRLTPNTPAEPAKRGPQAVFGTRLYGRMRDAFFGALNPHAGAEETGALVSGAAEKLVDCDLIDSPRSSVIDQNSQPRRGEFGPATARKSRPVRVLESARFSRFELEQDRNQSRESTAREAIASEESCANTNSAVCGVTKFPKWKRVLDLFCVAITAPVWVPLMLVVAVFIKMVSRGPVFFRQRRVGLGGNQFTILKFRSMHVDAETSGHEGYVQQLIQENRPMTKLDDAGDSRVISGGRFLRATALDELAQIFNVIRGDMSLVGPRPCTPAEFEEYDEEHRERFLYPPGLTGAWQVNGKNRLTFSEMIEMDTRYGRTMSVLGDLRIILKTFPTLLMQVLDCRAKSTGRSRADENGEIPRLLTFKETENSI